MKNTPSAPGTWEWTILSHLRDGDHSFFVLQRRPCSRVTLANVKHLGMLLQHEGRTPALSLGREYGMQHPVHDQAGHEAIRIRHLVEMVPPAAARDALDGARKASYVGKSRSISKTSSKCFWARAVAVAEVSVGDVRRRGAIPSSQAAKHLQLNPASYQ